MAGVDNGTDFDRDVLAIEEGHHGLAFLQLASGVAVAVSVLEVPEEWVNNLAIERVLFDEGDVGGRKFQCFLSGEKTFCEFSVHTTNVAHLGYLSNGELIYLAPLPIGLPFNVKTEAHVGTMLPLVPRLTEALL
jgi:hypothetical protein